MSGTPVHDPACDRWSRDLGYEVVAVDDGLCVVMHTGAAGTFTVTDVDELRDTLMLARAVRDGIEHGLPAPPPELVADALDRAARIRKSLL